MYIDSKQNMLTEILGEVRTLKQQIGRLTEEVVTVRNEVRQLKLIYSEEIKTNLVPPLPIKTVKQLEELHKQIEENVDIVAQLKYVIGKVGGDSSNSFVRNAIKKMLSDDVAAKLSWRGTNSKPSIQEFNITKIITSVCHSKFPKADDAGINKVLQQHFVHAGDRLRKSDRTKKIDEAKKIDDLAEK
ncbi:uncharacterized protein LOC119614857 [Lucilia sericata]|uniref:uncharacterized protein LOC119614857 n=1 Tax=Lucilia sericata TaxID=13632 RepID=UPI0018A86CDE|nr:uncharacterized protein LOC119614857 [Lucilia sericata]